LAAGIIDRIINTNTIIAGIAQVQVGSELKSYTEHEQAMELEIEALKVSFDEFNGIDISDTRDQSSIMEIRNQAYACEYDAVLEILDGFFTPLSGSISHREQGQDVIQLQNYSFLEG
jgi:hypothetical protein